jgi:hypothetical protein
MKPFSTPDLRRMNSRELAAFQADVLKGVSIARERQRQGEAVLDDVRRARTAKRVRTNL